MRSRSHSRSVSDRRSFSRSPYKRNERRSYSRHRSNTRSRTSSSRPPSPPSMPVKGRYGRYSDSRSYSRSITPRYNSRYTKRRYDSRTPSRSRTRSRSISRHSDERYKRVTREKPPPSRCIGVFGLSVATTQQKIREIFAKYGPIERIQVVIDAQTGHSRGFCFIYYENLADAKTARHYCCGLEVDGRRIRVDYSITERPHTPTPGVYKGRPTRSRRDKYRSSSRRRSPSPYAKRSSHHSRRRYERSRSSSYSSRRFRY